MGLHSDADDTGVGGVHQQRHKRVNKEAGEDGARRRNKGGEVDAGVKGAAEGDSSKESAHTLPCEEGGLTMIEMIIAMKKDAVEQESLVLIISDLISETVQRNDARNVSEVRLTYEV